MIEPADDRRWRDEIRDLTISLVLMALAAVLTFGPMLV
jgi:hypothetical protein